MGTAELASISDRLSRLLEQCELLPGRLGRRQAVLDEMQSLGLHIDAAYASFVKSPKTPADHQLLSQTQFAIQAQIEQLRREADALMTQWWEVHRAVGTELAEAAGQTSALLPALANFSRLPTPGNSNPKLQVLRLRELLRNALQLLACTESAAAPREVKEVQGSGGLLTAKQTATALGISDKTIYRLAKEGRIPYSRIHSSLRFRQADIDAWLESKSFQPAGMKKTTPGKGLIRGTASNR